MIVRARDIDINMAKNLIRLLDFGLYHHIFKNGKTLSKNVAIWPTAQRK
jgi:hypothetical protein